MRQILDPVAPLSRVAVLIVWVVTGAAGLWLSWQVFKFAVHQALR
jgi:hypothetical protein